jgi:nucleoside-diphosphate-sugar epimerase
MRVFVAGATGAIGRRLIPRLVSAGHDVWGMTRTDRGAAALLRQKANPAVCDVYDRTRLWEAMRKIRPEVVIHELTDLPRKFEPRKLTRIYAANNRIRREGTTNLVDAARNCGVRRFVVQSMASWYAPGTDRLRTEEDPLYLDAPEPVGTAVRALKFMEDLVLTSDMEAIVLRYGGFYGPGTWLAAEGHGRELLMRRQYPVISGRGGIYSWIHVDDAASATVATLVHGATGIYNVVDDQPAPARDWLPACAQASGAPLPRTVPRWLAGLVLGRGFVAWERTIPGASNRKIKTQIGWTPEFRTWRDGFRAEGRSAAGGNPAAPAGNYERVR